MDGIFPRRRPHHRPDGRADRHKTKNHHHNRHGKTNTSPAATSRTRKHRQPRPQPTHGPRRHHGPHKSHKTHKPSPPPTPTASPRTSGTVHPSQAPTNSLSIPSGHGIPTAPFGVPPRITVSTASTSSHVSPITASPTPSWSDAGGSNNDSSGALSSGEIAAAAVAPAVVILLAALALFFYFRRRKNRGPARGVTQQSHSSSSSPMEQVAYYPKANSATVHQPRRPAAYRPGPQTADSAEVYAAGVSTERSSGSFERRMKDAPPPPYVSRSDNNAAPRIDSSTIQPVSPILGGPNQDPFGDPEPRGSPSFSQAVFTENPSFAHGSSNRSERNDISTDDNREQREMKTSNRSSSPTLGLEGGKVIVRDKDDDEVSAISEGEEDDVEYGEAEMVGQAGTAHRQRASVIDMSGMGTSPPRDSGF